MWFNKRSSPIAALLLTAPSLSAAFYLPGVAPTSYDEGQSVPLYVNHLTPGLAQQDEQLHSVFSYDYYHPAFHFCAPPEGPKDVRESLGSILFGDRIQTSPFELHMGKNETCKAVCGPASFDARSAKFVNRRIQQGYNINWLVDGLPGAQINMEAVTQTKFYSPGFALGSINDEGQPVLNNHFEILIEYHRVGYGNQDKYRVVGVLVQPESRRNSMVSEDGTAQCDGDGVGITLNEEGETAVTWTYSVYWRESPTAWATRWDKYLHVYDPKIHWFSLINSAVFVVFLVAMVSMILVRALKKDIARYNRLDMINLDDFDSTSAAVEDGIQEDSGWKLVHGDVFRCPKSPLLLSVLVGNGAQLFMMTGVTVGRYILCKSDSPLANGYSFRTLWSALPREPWLPGHCNPSDLYAFRLHWWLRIGPSLQIAGRRCLETQHYHDPSAGSRAHLWRFLPSEPVRLGQGIEWCRALWHYACPGPDLVRD